MPRKKITLGYIKEKIKKEGIDSLTPTEANALATYKKLGQFGGKQREEKAQKIIDIKDRLPAKEKLDKVRDQLDEVYQFIWDKAMEGLSSPKATGKWPDFMNTIERLSNMVKVASDGSVIELDWDTCATSEALEGIA
jgi:hypothetical protein